MREAGNMMFVTFGGEKNLFSVSSFPGIVENMAEFRPEMCTEAAQQGLMQWLLKRLKVSWFLSFLLQTS